MVKAAVSFFRVADAEILEQAKKDLKRDPKTNAFVHVELIEQVEKLIPFNAKVERRKKAERLVRDAERPAHTEPDGSLWLPGFDPISYEPDRLIQDGRGNTVEQGFAKPEFMQAALERKAENIRRLRKAYARDRFVTDEYSEWVSEQLQKGRPENELTYGNFVRAKGYWKQKSVQGELDVDGE